MSRFYDLFQRKPVLGMLHLSGKHPVIQALDDLRIYEEGEVDGVIVENYHGTEEDVRHTLEAISRRTTPLKVGVNVLGSLELLLNSQREVEELQELRIVSCCGYVITFIQKGRRISLWNPHKKLLLWKTLMRRD